MDLQDPTKKMSKSSESPQGRIDLFDDPTVIERRIKRAVTDTDSGPDAVRYDPDTKPGVATLLELLALSTDRDPVTVAQEYTRYGDLKADTAAAVIEMARPIRLRYHELSQDPASVTKVLRVGAERAEAVAAVTLRRAMDAIGLLPPG
jgi:tryptophanyl-tRNA synthetase